MSSVELEIVGLGRITTNEKHWHTLLLARACRPLLRYGMKNYE